jgi:hypothetical protein
LLSDVLADEGGSAGELTPWREPPLRAPLLSGRISATDRLSWWFRPLSDGRDPWESYFEPEAAPAPPPRSPAATAATASPPAAPDGEPLGRRAALRLLLAEPDEELIDSDADAVVTCLYDFVHAVGRRDVATAIDECVDPDYHTLENDVEIDRDGLAAQLESLLDRLRGWELDVSLVEIPEPILHPDAILVWTELQIEAHRDGEHQTLLHSRLAVFRRGRDRRWLISALSPV